MTSTDIVILTIPLAFFAFLMFLFIRNFEVYKFSKKVLKFVSKKAKEDIDRGQDWERWYAWFDKVSYDEMMYKFWKPLKSFYPIDIDKEDV